MCQDMKIVVVDDEELMRNLVVQILTRSGFTPHPFADAARAWKFLQYHEPDILISDLHMGEMGGIELLKLVKKEVPTVKCLMMSADLNKRRRVLDLGADAFLGKPFLCSDLVKIIRAMAAARAQSL